MEKQFSFPNNEKLDLKSSDHDTENIYEPEKNNYLDVYKGMPSDFIFPSV